jgi:cyclophilin family peptidyl-prolyl cis-trans isomerase
MPRRLELEALEDRCLLSANIAPFLSGKAFVDAAHTGTFQTGDAVLPGVSVSLSGTTFLGTTVGAATTTDANGGFQFLHVPNGTYQVSFTPVTGFLGGRAGIGNVSVSSDVSVVSGIVVSNGQSVTGQLAFGGIEPQIISERMFLASATASAFPRTGTAGVGSVAATGPFVRESGGIPAVNLTSTGSQNVDLAGFFSAPDITTSQVTFDISAGGQRFALQVELFDAQAPQTVANFLDYLHSGSYGFSIFHRLTNLATDGLAVLQGGGATFGASRPPGPRGVLSLPTLLPITITNPGVANEFGTSNTAGTIAMALSGGNQNSATDQFFFNLVNNAAALDPQRFTVFGRVVGPADQDVLKTLATTTVHDESGTSFATGTPNPLPGVSLNQVPLNPSTFPTNDSGFPVDTNGGNYILVVSIAVTRQNEALTYSVTSGNPSVATAAIVANTSELLKLQAVGSGTTTITVTATDQFGTSQQTSFKVTVP